MGGGNDENVVARIINAASITGLTDHKFGPANKSNRHMGAFGAGPKTK